MLIRRLWLTDFRSYTTADVSFAEDLTAKAHQVCPYSNATRGNIEVTLTLS